MRTTWMPMRGSGRRRRSPSAILPPWARPPPQTRGPEQLDLSELGPGRLPIYQRANRPLEDRWKETRRPNPHPLAWRKKNLVWDAIVTDTLAASYLPDTSLTAGVGREGVNPQNRKVQRIILDPPLYPLALETLGPINCEGLSFSRSLDKSYGPLPARCAKLLSFFSAFRLPLRDLMRWHLEGHSPAKTQTNCDSYDTKSATVNTSRTLVGLRQAMDETFSLLFATTVIGLGLMIVFS